MYLGILSACIIVHHMCAQGPLESERVLEPLKVELRVVVSYCVGARSSGRRVSSLNCGATSPIPVSKTFVSQRPATPQSRPAKTSVPERRAGSLIHQFCVPWRRYSPHILQTLR